MGFNFPNAPITGQLYPATVTPGLPQYRYDGEKWKAIVAVAGSASVFISDTAPAAPVDGMLWWESDSGLLFVRYNDGDSTQWVIVGQFPNLTGMVRYDADQSATITAAQKSVARQNVYAAPFDAMSFNGIQVNGSGEVSQERGSGGFNPGSGSYTCDNWYVGGSRSGAVFTTAQNVLTQGGATPAGLFTAPYLALNTGPFTTWGASEYSLLQTKIEGIRCRKLSWGYSTAVPLAIGFYVYASVAGTATFTIRNSAPNRTYVKDFTIAVGWNWVSFIVPGDTTGTWLNDAGIGAICTWCFGAGSSYNNGVNNSWQAGSPLATPATSVNLFGTAGNTYNVTGFVAIPGVDLPAASEIGKIQRPFDTELVLVRRQYENGLQPQSFRTTAAGIANAYDWMRFQTRKRATPTVSTPNGWAYFNAGGSTVGVPNWTAWQVDLDFFSWMCTSLTNWAGWQGAGTWAADARL